MNMKRLIFIVLAALSLSACTKNTEYRIDGETYNKQIFDARNRQITNFKNWELISDFFVSPDGKKMLVYHRPDKSRAFLITLFDLPHRKIIAECEPGWACSGVRWTEDYLIYVWATTGGGTNFEYRNYNNLAVEKTINAFLPFEDQEDNILIGASYFYGEPKVVFYNYSSGAEIKAFDCVEELKSKGINANYTRIDDIRKTGKSRYEFDVMYCSDPENMEEELQTVLELEL